MTRRWSGVIAREGVQTGDGRVIADGALYWEDLPVTLRWDREDDGGHTGAVAVGTIDVIERRDGGDIWASGTIDDAEGSDGAEAVRLMEQGILRGVSIDPDDWEVVIIDTTVTEADVEAAEAELAAIFAAAGDPDPGPDAGVVLFEDESGSIIERLTRGRIRAATLVDTPAFIDATITLDDGSVDEGDSGDEAPAEPDDEAEPVAASAGHDHGDCGCGGTCGGCATAVVHQLASVTAAASAPPAEWFVDPQLDHLTPITVTDDGRVFGHVADHGTCHVGMAGCTTAPPSATGYSDFHRYTETAGGTPLPVAVGRITGGHGAYVDACSCCPGSDDHACMRLSYGGAIAQHDQMATLAYVRAGEDERNNAIWVAGVVAPEATAEDRALLARQLVSGDWRPKGAGLELTEVLALHRERPGFPLAVVAAGGRVRALVAAGIVMPQPDAAPPVPAPAGLSADDARLLGQEAGKAFAAVLDQRAAAPHRRRLAALAAERDREDRATALARLNGAAT